MQAKAPDYSKQKRGQHKVRGKVKNRKEGVSPASLNKNTMTPANKPNQADMALAKLRRY